MTDFEHLDDEALKQQIEMRLRDAKTDSEHRDDETLRKLIELRLSRTRSSILPRGFKPSVALVEHLLSKLRESGSGDEDPAVHHLEAILRLLRENPDVPAEEIVRDYESRSGPGGGTFGILYPSEWFDDFDPD